MIFAFILLCVFVKRMIAEQERIKNLEQRLACLLCTPPVLNDPYLVPQPIEIELPHKLTKTILSLPSMIILIKDYYYYYH